MRGSISIDGYFCQVGTVVVLLVELLVELLDGEGTETTEVVVDTGIDVVDTVVAVGSVEVRVEPPHEAATRTTATRVETTEPRTPTMPTLP